MSDSNEMQYLTITSTEPVIDFDYEGMKARIEKHLEQYDIVVTEDTVADAKAMATELNKQAGEIDRRRIDTIRAISAPIKEAEDRLKELSKLCKDGRQRILDQVQVFEAQRLTNCTSRLADERDAWRNTLEVDKEFWSAEIEDLVKLGSLTSTDRLTKAAKDEVRARVEAEKAVQDRTKLRLLELENRSLKAGLSAPLLRENVEHILMRDDEAYNAGLERIFEGELKRQEQIELRQRQEQERKERLDRELAESRPKEEPPEPAPAPEREPPASASAPGKVRWRVTVTFELETSDKIVEQQVRSATRNKLQQAGVSPDTITSLDVLRQGGDNG